MENKAMGTALTLKTMMKTTVNMRTKRNQKDHTMDLMLNTITI